MQKHSLLTSIVGSMHNGYTAGEDAISRFWFTKAMAQSKDISMRHLDDVKVDEAIGALLLGELSSDWHA